MNNAIVKTNAKTIRLKYVAEIFIGLTYSPVNLTDKDSGLAVLRANNIQNGRLIWDGMAYVNCNVPDKLLLRKKDILVCSRNGSKNLIGKCGKVTEEFCNKTFGAFNTVVRSNYSDFLYYIFHSQLFTDQSGAFSTSTINQLTLGMFNAMAFPFPSNEVQKEVVILLDKWCHNIDYIIDKTNLQIKFLTEYRTRLISDIVTGKVDVRSIAIPEYELEKEIVKEIMDEDETEEDEE